MDNKKKQGLILIGAFLVAIIVSYVVFSKAPSLVKTTTVVPAPTVKPNGTVAFDNALPKTEECPINGAKYSTQQRSWWEQHRPLGVMIENHEDSRPQSGLSFADVVYEAVAEGGITRFLAIFYCQDANPIGPVRSARTYFIDLVSEYGDSPLYTHVGGANASGPADALGQLDDYGWAGYNDLNQFSIGFPTFWRDYDRLGHTVATEHTMYSTTTKLWDFAKKDRGLTNVDKKGNAWDTKFVKYTFVDDDASAAPATQTIHEEFWNGYGAYFVDWAYDKATNSYKRSNGGKPHTDLDTKKQLTAKNVVVLSMKESNAFDGYENNVHLLYVDKGTGKARVFMNGKDIQATWRKDSRTSRLLLFDQSGKPISFVRGKIWFSILPTGTGVLTVK